jgi:hypothetical protein
MYGWLCFNEMQCEAMDNELERVFNGGANAWDYVYLDDYRTSSGHWMSLQEGPNDSASRQVRYIPQQASNGSSCDTADGTRMLNFAAPDLVRKPLQGNRCRPWRLRGLHLYLVEFGLGPHWGAGR